MVNTPQNLPDDGSAPDAADLYAALSPENQLKLLKDRLSAALKQIAKDTSPRYFVETETVNLKDLVNSRDYHAGHGGRSQKITGEDLALKLIAGHPHEAEDVLIESYSEYNYNQDKEWQERQLRQLLRKQFHSELDLVAEALEQDLDELADELVYGKDLSIYQVHEGGLHSTNIRYTEKISTYVDLNLSVGLEPNPYLAETLWRLRVSPEEFLSNLRSRMEEHESSAGGLRGYEWGLREDGSTEELFDQYQQELLHAVGVLTTQGFHFASSPDEALVNTGRLVQKLHAEWNGTGTLYLLFNLDATHINNVSFPVGNRLDENAADRAQIDISGAVLANSSTLNDGDPIHLLKPLTVTMADLRLQQDFQVDVKAHTSLRGTFAVDSALYELLTSGDYGANDPNHPLRLARNLKPGFPSDHVATPLVDKILAQADGFQLHKMRMPYSGLESLIDVHARQRRETSTPQSLGEELLRVLGGWVGNGRFRWEGSEEQEYAHWLLEQGADVSLTEANGINAMHRAAALGDVELMKSLHARGCDVTARCRVPSGDEERKDTVWELVARRALRLRGTNIDPELEALHWLELQGASLPASRTTILSFDADRVHEEGEVYAELKSQELLNRRLHQLHDSLDETEFKYRLDKILYAGLTYPSTMVALAATEAGADLDVSWGAGIKNQTIENAARDAVKERWNFDTNVFENAISLCRAHKALKAIDATSGMPLKPLTP